MSLQVGTLCYASRADAGVAACSYFQPVSAISGSQMTTVSCSGATSNGSLEMTRSVVDTALPAQPVVTSFTQVVDFAPCIQADYVSVFNGLLGPVLALIVVCWGLWKVSSYLGWGRADAS